MKESYRLSPFPIQRLMYSLSERLYHEGAISSAVKKHSSPI